MREKMFAAISGCIAILLNNAALAGPAKQASLEECLQLRAEIEDYTELRRRGGSAEDMDDWKRSRRELEQRFRDMRCRRYGKAVR